MAQKKKKISKKKVIERKLKVGYIPELCHREYSDATMVNYKDSGMFAISFITINPHKPNEGNATTVIFMEEIAVEQLTEQLSESLLAYRKGRKKS